jgi:hypothetical protein
MAQATLLRVVAKKKKQNYIGEKPLSSAPITAAVVRG